MENDMLDFKPITEGLGFHKKIIDIKDEGPTMTRPLNTTMLGAQKNPQMTQPMTQAPRQMAQPNQSTNYPQQPKTQMPRTILPNKQMPQPAPGQMRKPHQWSPQLGKLDILERETPKVTYVPVANSWNAILFDTGAVIGLGCFFTASVFALTTLEFDTLREIIFNELGSQFAMGLLFFCVHIMYAVASRTFLGKTLGEWTFDYRMGSEEEQQRVLYPILVAWRAILVGMTGFITLPILSLIMGRDVAGVFTGVSLQAEKK